MNNSDAVNTWSRHLYRPLDNSSHLAPIKIENDSYFVDKSGGDIKPHFLRIRPKLKLLSRLTVFPLKKSKRGAGLVFMLKQASLAKRKT